MSIERAVERLSSGSWLTPQIVRFAAWMMFAGTIALLAFLFLDSHGLVDFKGRPIGTDFSSFWTAGRLVLAGKAPLAYDWNALFEIQHRVFGVTQLSPWSYPPLFLGMAALFGSMPYLTAFVLWQGASLAAALFVYRKILPIRGALLFALAFPGVLVCIGHGQTGFLTASLMAGGLLVLGTHEVLAGVLFGLIAYKPQFGVLIPFVLAVGGYWRAFAAAAVTVLAAGGATYLAWGFPVWQAFFDSIPATRSIVFEAGDTGFEKFQSAFSWVRLWHGPLWLAYSAQAAVASAVLAVALWMWRNRTPFRLKAAALLIGSLLVSPYTLDYDFILLGMGLAFLTAHEFERGFRAWDKTLIAAAWFMPAVARSIAGYFYLPVGFLMLVAIFGLVALRAGEAFSPRRRAAPATLAPT